MTNLADLQDLSELHPSLWRASQIARSTIRCLDTGHAALNHQLSGGGWPTGTLVELMVQNPGIGEFRLLAPALASVAHRQIVLIEPPHPPHTIALANLGLKPSDVLWIKSKVTSDALWAAEQTLRSGNFGAVLFWTNHVRPESLRRLNLAAQAGEALFVILRPLAAAQDASPAPLRLGLRPAANGIDIEFIKRRGPSRDEPLFLPLSVPHVQTRPRILPLRIPVPAPGPIPVEAHHTVIVS